MRGIPPGIRLSLYVYTPVYFSFFNIPHRLFFVKGVPRDDRNPRLLRCRTISGVVLPLAYISNIIFTVGAVLGSITYFLSGPVEYPSRFVPPNT